MVWEELVLMVLLLKEASGRKGEGVKLKKETRLGLRG